MKIFHFSDNHGRIDWLKEAIPDDVDLIVSTGDFFPNASRGVRKIEVPFQIRWLDACAENFMSYLKDKPIMIVGGNHDYIPLAQDLILRGYGGRVIPITIEGVMFDGLRFAGFPHIPYISGEWNLEVDYQEMRDLVEETMESNPDVLVTHCPPAGILDDGYGNEPLLTQLTYQDHNIKHHLFGHCHLSGGKEVERMEIWFHNAACHGMIFEI